MYDYNFFENYKAKKKTQEKGSGLIIITFLVALLIIGGVAGLSFWQNVTLVADNLIMSTELALQENVDTFSKIESKQNLNTTLKEISQNLSGATGVVEQREVIKQELLDMIILSLPSDAELNSMSLTNEVISINGAAAQRSAIAEFQKSLRDTGAFQEVTVTSINTELDEFTFDMSITLGGVNP